MSHTKDDRQVVAIFGVGLIGHSIVKAMSNIRPCKIERLPFTWNTREHQTEELKTIRERILELQSGMPAALRLDFVWAAGRSGFNSSERDLLLEKDTFEDVLSCFCQFSTLDIQTSFHLVSSAGGLYEGQKHVDRTSNPLPRRPYSEAKLQQEQRLSDLPARTRKVVYRLSSVYGFSGKGMRFGLINTLIRNAFLHRSTRVFGDASTIRDYVLAADVGTFMANRARDNGESATYILASGKPTTIFEILHYIERITGRRPLYSFSKVPTNAANISFSPAILPDRWIPTDVETGLRRTWTSYQVASCPSVSASEDAATL